MSISSAHERRRKPEIDTGGADGCSGEEINLKYDGTVAGGNASGINNVAAAVLIMSADKAENLGLSSLSIMSS